MAAATNMPRIAPVEPPYTEEVQAMLSQSRRVLRGKALDPLCAEGRIVDRLCEGSTRRSQVDTERPWSDPDEIALAREFIGKFLVAVRILAGDDDVLKIRHPPDHVLDHRQQRLGNEQHPRAAIRQHIGILIRSQQRVERYRFWQLFSCCTDNKEQRGPLVRCFQRIPNQNLNFFSICSATYLWPVSVQ